MVSKIYYRVLKQDWKTDLDQTHVPQRGICDRLDLRVAILSQERLESIYVLPVSHHETYNEISLLIVVLCLWRSSKESRFPDDQCICGSLNVSERHRVREAGLQVVVDLPAGLQRVVGGSLEVFANEADTQEVDCIKVSGKRLGDGVVAVAFC
jgi:hypothetical protein